MNGGIEAPPGRIQNLQWTDNGNTRTFTWDPPVGYEVSTDPYSMPTPQTNPLTHYTWSWWLNGYQGSWYDIDVGGMWGPYQINKNTNNTGALNLTSCCVDSEGIGTFDSYLGNDWADPLQFPENEVSEVMIRGNAYQTISKTWLPPLSEQVMKLTITAHNGFPSQAGESSVYVWFTYP